MGKSPGHTTYIYVLCDPATGKPHYVGRADNPRVRFFAHRDDALERRKSKTPKEQWVLSLINKGVEPQMRILEQIHFPEYNYSRIGRTAFERERHWISYFTKRGYVLANIFGKRQKWTKTTSVT